MIFSLYSAVMTVNSAWEFDFSTDLYQLLKGQQKVKRTIHALENLTSNGRTGLVQRRENGKKNVINVSKYVKHVAKDCPCLFYTSKRDLN